MPDQPSVSAPPEGDPALAALRARLDLLEAEKAAILRALTDGGAPADATDDIGGMLRLAQDAGGICSWQWDVQTGALRWSDSCHLLHGTGPAEAPSYERWFSGIHPLDRDQVQSALEHVLAGGSDSWDTEFRYTRHDDGSVRWLVGRGRVMRDPATGAPQRLLGIGLDITAIKAAEERQALLMQELDHRVRNLLAVVQAALRLTPKGDPEAYARAVEGRIAALARAHGMLAAARWGGSDLRDLLAGELAAFLDGRRVELDGPSVMLPARITQALAMTVHELATNAVKHGALSGPQGRIAVSWAVSPHGTEGPLLSIRWAERGGPPAAAPRRRGFGSRVLDAAIRVQLKGTFQKDWGAEGLVCRLDVPLGADGTETSRVAPRSPRPK
ncbi:sensor histidine kinase [Falsiroseomonas oryziterrae]|uniref:sensor histidine kinase n=1 Tax=Falsiroseomonas oryziterrae TaxID=2911368 RepID=UPI001F018A83|nr:sensor histidine kinase [Roseomonas sp. NPKOSM-4]